MTIWRIATDTPDYTADDTSGAGAKTTGGRWNRPGTPMLYCAGSIALACLETLVHIRLGELPLNRYLVAIEVPEDVWRKATVFAGTGPHVGWDAIPHGKVSLDAGEKWLGSKASLLYKVPSVIVPQEINVLVNPAHPDAAGLTFRKVGRWTYDSRLAPRAKPKKTR
ncbi:RES family NAD+ phosphorylase [Paraburkholderia domus]|uniref:RES family NAD+ phosphorylase n=1 Tax=Paraburkholderia domus TaxID=2793075 RepID=UPI001F466A95|nr:RES family NAD+ phosphorylase [Paraburkholderia domus]